MPLPAASKHHALTLAAILGLVAAATLCTYLAFPDPTRRVVLFYFIIMIVSAWRWGRNAGLLATFLSTLAFSSLVWPQLLNSFNQPFTLTILSSFILIGICFSIVCGSRAHAEKLLAESELRFRSLADTAPVLIWLSDDSKSCVWFNKHWLEFRGRTLDQEFGDGWAQGVHPDDLPRCLETYTRSFDARQPFSMEYRLQRADGQFRWILDTGVPRFTADNKFLGYIGSCVDIHQQKLHLQNYEEHAELLNTTLSSIGDGVVVTDTQSRITFMNPVAERETGWSSANALHRPLSEVFQIIHEKTGKPLPNLAESALAKNAAATIPSQSLLLRPDGTTIPIEDSAAPIRDSHGTLRGVVLVFRNIASRQKQDAGRGLISRAAKTLSASLDYEANLWTVARMAVPILGDCCVIHHLNDQGQALSLAMGCTNPQLEQAITHLLKTFRPEPTDLRGPTEAVAKGQSILYESISDQLLTEAARNSQHLQLLRSIRAVSAMFVPLKILDRPIGVLSFVSIQPNRRFGPADLTLAEELAAHAANSIHNAQLFQEKDRADKAKDHFLAVLSHELRTPLTPVLSVVSMLTRVPTLDPAIRDDLRLVKRNVELEARLIDDLLDLTRIRKGKFVLEKSQVDLPRLLEETIAICRSEADERGVRITFDCDSSQNVIVGDPTRLQQAFWNIVKNAIKFTAAGGTVRLTCSNENDSHVRVTITDTGVGIEPDFLNRIFDAFQQAERDGQRFGGLGLGLAITRAIIERHHGTIHAQSQGLDAGTTFTVVLPATRLSSSAVTPPREVVATPQRRLKIFLIEDHKDTAAVMARFLASLGHTVTPADSCKTALALWKPRTFDLIVSDIGLTDGNGVDLLRDLHAIDRVPAIALSGNGMESDIRRSLSAGFLAHLTKPLDIEALENAIHRATTAPTEPAEQTIGNA